MENMDKQTLLTTLGFEDFTPMQQQMANAASSKGGVVLLSPTGSGKTIAYLFPLVNSVNVAIDGLQAVVIVPTRELACQSEEVLKSMKSGIRSLSLYGGRPTMEEHRKIKEVHPQVVFATPGRLNDHLTKENLNAFGVKLLVIDEFDKCLELGFQNEMEQTLKHFKHIGKCWLMSATDAEAIPQFMGKVVESFRKLDFLSETKHIEQRVELWKVLSPEKDKLQTLGQILTHVKGQPAIVFVAYRESVERVGKWLLAEHFPAVMYHGGMEQDVRERALYKFRSGAANILVSTDLAARGLDIPEVRVVIHYHLPLKKEAFVHRNGRTARWDAEGAIYMIIGPTEQLPEYAENAELKVLDTTAKLQPTQPLYTTLYIGRGKRDKLSKGDVLGFLCKKGGLKSSDIGRIDVGTHHAYVAVLRTRIKDVLKLVAGEKIKGMKTLIEEMRK